MTNRRVIASQADVTDSMPMDLIPNTTPAELEEYKAASIHYWSADEMRKRRTEAVRRVAAEEAARAHAEKTGEMRFTFRKV